MLLQLQEIASCITVFLTIQALSSSRTHSLGNDPDDADYNIPWRTLFIINPAISQAGNGLMYEGQVVRIGRKFRLHSSNPAYKYSIENASATFSASYANLYNHNAASLYRLFLPGKLKSIYSKVVCQSQQNR
jgi:hypothetical protein